MALSTPISGSPALDLESHLISRAVSGEAAAFEKLYRQHLAKIYSLVRRMTNAEMADEITQDVFVRAWERLSSFQGRSAFGTWLHRLAVNVVLSRRRKDRTEGNYLIADDSTLEFVGKHPTIGIGIDLEQAMSCLPEGARQVFVLHDVEGWTHEEIADQLGMVSGTSKSQLSRARAALRRMLDGY